MAKRKLYSSVKTNMWCVYQVGYLFGHANRWPVVAWPSVKECRAFIESKKGNGITYMVEEMKVTMAAWDGTITENIDQLHDGGYDPQSK